MEELLLPGEAACLHIDQAERLSAVDAAQEGCIGCLITTPHGNALATTTLLEVREVSARPVGAVVNVVAVGRVSVPQIEHGRYWSARGVRVVHDEPACNGDDEAECEVSELWPEIGQLEAHEEAGSRTKIAQTRRALELAALDEQRERMCEELHVVNLDAAPLPSLARLHALWGVEDDVAIHEQLLSYAACETLSAVQRSIALGMVDTRERMRFAQRCRLKASKRAAAELALGQALGSIQ